MKFTRSSLLEFHAEMSKKAAELMALKNHDYAGSEGLDPFANFRRSEAMGITTTAQAMLVRMTDKFSRLATFCQGGILKVKDESVDDTCLDLVNYSILFAALAKEMKHEAEAQTTGGIDPDTQLELPSMQTMERFRKYLRDGPGKRIRKDNVGRRGTGRSGGTNRRTVQGKGGSAAHKPG